MPTYEYRCKECEHGFETVQSFSDDPLEECPECQGRLRKVYGNVGISFKGSGFYKNDARGSSKSKSASTSTANGSTDGSTSDAASTSSNGKSDTATKTPATTSTTSTTSSSD